MNYLRIENGSKSYGDKILFSELNLTINQGDKIALVAQNGSGKTTLLKILNGEESVEGENSKIYIKTGLSIGYLKQDSNLHQERTVLEEALATSNPKIQAIKNYEEALLFGKSSEIQKAIAKIEDLKAWDIEARVKEILGKLDVHQFDQKVKNLSGGQMKRLALAKVLISNPDFLILDEPTNHLDLEMIEWLEQYLRQAHLTVFMVTHDRYFLENVCDTIVDLEESQLSSFKGNYSQYLEKKTSIRENERVVVGKMKKLYKKELDWIRRQPKARGTKAKARIDKFYEIKEKSTKKVSEDELEFIIQSKRLGSKILELHYVSKSFGDKMVLDNFYYKFTKGEKVGLVGPNGVGKTSFINLITGMLSPDQGKVIVGETVQFGIFSQAGLQLKEDKRIIDVVRDIAEYIPLEKGFKMTAASLLERFLFPRKHHRVYYSQLSGGEKRRLYLLTVLMKNPNFLILDEPTNDLDILTLNILEDYLKSFKGCLMIVSHDRYFMDKIVDHIFVLNHGGFIKDYNGNYTAFKREFPNGIQIRQNKTKPTKEVLSAPANNNRPQTISKKLSYKDQRRLGELENELDSLENKKTELSNLFSTQNLDSAKMNQVSIEISQLVKKIEELELEWMEIADKLN